MKKRQVGRPPVPESERRSHRVSAYLTEADFEELIRRAEADEVTASTKAWEILARSLRRKGKER